MSLISIPDTPAIVRLDNIGVTYPDGNVALKSVSLQLNRGEFAVVLGASGAGKSTLLRTINYLTPPSQGTVLVRGLDDGIVKGHARDKSTNSQPKPDPSTHPPIYSQQPGRYLPANP